MPEPTATGPVEFSCAICGKSFERRDLRERHRRRCEKSVEKGRAPKRKSCSSCVRSKVKCDLRNPACQRCMDRRINCEYPVDVLMTEIAQLSEGNPVAFSTTSDSHTTSPINMEPANAQVGAMPGGMEQIALDDMTNIDWGNWDGGAAGDFWNASAWNATPVEMEALSMSTAGEAPSVFGGGYSWDSIHESASERLQRIDVPSHHRRIPEPDNMSSLNSPGEFSMPTPATISGWEKPAQGVSTTGNKKRNRSQDRNTEKGSNVQTQLIPHPTATSPVISLHPFGRQSKSPTPYFPNFSNAPPSNKQRRTSLKASNGFSRANSSSGSSASLPLSGSPTLEANGLFGVDDITKVICDYPRHMLRQEFWSPFVHHRHYRCSQGGLAEPIAIALCCVSANLQSVESSIPFVCKMINNERERLVNEFPTKSENLEDAIAALHAMCIYQIETILALRSQKTAKQQISSAELYHHFLLKMTRRLCHEHLERVTLKDNMAIRWQCWTMAETLRRTTFLVNMINELSYHTNALNNVYYEPLQESLVLDMPLPAPDIMWRALNEDDWAAARDASGWTGAGVMTVRTVINRLQAQLDGHGSSVEDQGCRHENIQQISNLIISSARHLKRE